MLTLGIESTCDETACSVVKDGKEILSNVIASQTDLHALYGGVFPELACRRHFEVLIPTIKAALKEANVTKEALDLIAVAQGPGLIGALLIGVHAAKSLSIAWNKPWIGVNHVEAHIYAAMMHQQEPIFPSLGVVISGGHTFMAKMESLGDYQIIGRTVDDAIGEAFDKVGVMLGLPYPAGPDLELLAKKGDPSRYTFKAGRVKKNPWNFSFSGLKTNVLYTIKGQDGTRSSPSICPADEAPHIAAAFQEAALGVIAEKTILAAQTFGCKAIYFGGGVSNNQRLRDLLIHQQPVFFPPPRLTGDNGAMIAGLGTHLFLKTKRSDPLDLEPFPCFLPINHLES